MFTFILNIVEESCCIIYLCYVCILIDKVQQVKMFKRNSEFCLFIAEVQRSQSLNKESHHPWAIVRENGSVITAHVWLGM